MSKSQRLNAGDVEQICELVGQCRELGSESDAWRLHLMAGLGRLIGATVACGMEVHLHGPRRLEVVRPVSLGWLHQEMGDLWSYFVAHVDPLDDVVLDRVYAAHQRRRRLLTQTREQLLDEQSWRRSEHYNIYRRTAEIDSCLYSWNPLTTGDGKTPAVDLIAIHRPPGDRPFGERERRLVHALHREVGQLIGRHLASAGEPSALLLPRRLRQVLNCLLEGDDQHAVAGRLGLSTSTVRQYISALYRRFGVSSRRELLARWIRFGPPPAIPDDLSNRQRQTLCLLLEGRNEAEIAEALGLSQATIAVYAGRLYEHFEVKNRAELLALWIHRRPGAPTAQSAAGK